LDQDLPAWQLPSSFRELVTPSLFLKETIELADFLDMEFLISKWKSTTLIVVWHSLKLKGYAFAPVWKSVKTLAGRIYKEGTTQF
jgi:hypothetical protein